METKNPKKKKKKTFEQKLKKFAQQECFEYEQ